MGDFLIRQGFLGTQAAFHSDAALVLTLVTAVLFAFGWQLARQKRFDAHRKVQTVGVILNTLVVLVSMIGSFTINILPGIPGKLNEGSYGITTVHALIGTIGLLLGVFIILRTNLFVPRIFRFNNYKLWMRLSFGIYLVATLLGVIVYIVVFIYGI